MSDTTTSIFPHPTLTAITTTPTQVTLRILRQEINANAIAIDSARGGGLLGHLSLVVTAAKFALRSAVPFVPPNNPGANPVHAIGATAAQISEVNRQFLVDKREFRLYRNTEAALKKALLQAVPRTFTKILCDDEIGYAAVSTLALLTHLETTYGTVTEEDLEKNEELLYKPWDMHSPIEDVFTQLRECIAFAVGHDTISEEKAIRAGLKVFKTTGHFSVGIREWIARPIAQKTLDNFRDHFTAANIERKRTATVTSEGYHHAASVQPTTSTTKQEYKYYCWTHGLGFNPNHTSSTCSNKAADHNNAATLDDMLGGSGTIQRKRNDPMIYKNVRNVRQRTANSATAPAATPATTPAN